MTAVTRSRLHELLQARVPAVASIWCDTIARTSFVPLDVKALHWQLLDLTGQILTVLLGEESSRREAQKIGATLAQLRYVRPEALGATLEILARELLAGLPGEDVVALQSDVAALLGEITSGFLRRHQATTLAEQDAIHRALLAASREATEALRASEDRYRAVVTQVKDGILLTDAGTKHILEANPAFQQLLGYTAQELAGMPLYQIVAHERASVDENIRQVLRNGQLDVSQRQCRRKDGALLTVEASISTLETARSTLLCSVVRDVTERIQAATELAEARRRLAEGREAERLQLAQELHDGTVQEILGLRYQLAATRRRAANGGRPIELIPELDRIGSQIAQVVGQLRGLIGELRPTGLDDLGLSAALENYVAGLQRAGKAVPVIMLDLAPCGTSLPGPVALCLFRVGQEAVRNALVHAQPNHVVIRLRLRSEGVILRVGDDGRGFTVPERLTALAQAEHYGLVGMAERVGCVNGRLRIRSRPGSGTVVTVWAPLPAEEEREGPNGSESTGPAGG